MACIANIFHISADKADDQIRFIIKKDDKCPLLVGGIEY